ncbi:MAG: LytTR family transcriptional regulator, partial [Ruminococcus sp.]
YETRVTLSELWEKLGDEFIKVNRGCIVSAMAIHDIADSINLNNGESLIYTLRKKSQIIEQFRSKQKSIISSFAKDGIPKTDEEYRSHYSSFENLPFAFTDIEMIFNDESHAVDWIFRYGNPALSELEKLPLERLIGSSFGSLFSNMDSKWLRSYERATLYGEMLEIIDYSPEIDTYLKVICFPTFKGHCGCILFDISQIKFTKNSSDAEKALMLYFGKLPEKN